MTDKTNEKHGDGNGISRSALTKSIKSLKDKFAAGSGSEDSAYDATCKKVAGLLNDALTAARSKNATKDKVNAALQKAGDALLADMKKISGSREASMDAFPNLDDRLETLGLLQLDLKDSPNLFQKTEAANESAEPQETPTMTTTAKSAPAATNETAAEQNEAAVMPAADVSSVFGFDADGNDASDSVEAGFKAVAEAEKIIDKFHDDVDAQDGEGLVNPTYGTSDEFAWFRDRVTEHVQMCRNLTHGLPDVDSVIALFKYYVNEDVADQLNNHLDQADARALAESVLEMADEAIAKMEKLMPGAAEAAFDVTTLGSGTRPAIHENVKAAFIDAAWNPKDAVKFVRADEIANPNPDDLQSALEVRNTFATVRPEVAEAAKRSPANAATIMKAVNEAFRAGAEVDFKIVKEDTLEVSRKDKDGQTAVMFESIEPASKPATTRKPDAKQTLAEVVKDVAEGAKPYLVRAGRSLTALETPADLKSESGLRNAIKKGGRLEFHAINERSSEPELAVSADKAIAETARRSSAGMAQAGRLFDALLAEHAAGVFDVAELAMTPEGKVAVTRRRHNATGGITEHIDLASGSGARAVEACYADGTHIIEGDIVALAKYPAKVWGRVTDVIDRGARLPVAERFDIYVDPQAGEGDALVHLADEIAPYRTARVLEAEEFLDKLVEDAFAQPIFTAVVLTHSMPDDRTTHYVVDPAEGHLNVYDMMTKTATDEDAAKAVSHQIMSAPGIFDNNGELAISVDKSGRGLFINNDTLAKINIKGKILGGNPELKEIEGRVRSVMLQLAGEAGAFQGNAESNDNGLGIAEGDRVEWAGLPGVTFGTVTSITRNNSVDEAAHGAWKIMVRPDKANLEALKGLSEGEDLEDDSTPRWLKLEHLTKAADQTPVLEDSLADRLHDYAGEVAPAIKQASASIQGMEFRHAPALAIKEAVLAALMKADEEIANNTISAEEEGAGSVNAANIFGSLSAAREMAAAQIVTPDGDAFPEAFPEAARAQADIYGIVNDLVRRFSQPEAVANDDMNDAEGMDDAAAEALVNSVLGAPKNDAGVVAESDIGDLIGDLVDAAVKDQAGIDAANPFDGERKAAVCDLVKQAAQTIAGIGDFQHAPAVEVRDEAVASLQSVCDMLAKSDAKFDDVLEAIDCACSGAANADLSTDSEGRRRLGMMVPEAAGAVAAIYPVLYGLWQSVGQLDPAHEPVNAVNDAVNDEAGVYAVEGTNEAVTLGGPEADDGDGVTPED